MKKLESITENNRLIAEFMGAYHEDGQPDEILVVPLGNDEYFIDINDEDSPKFQTSWDWLMPVVEKIIELKDVYGQKRNEVRISLSPNINSTYQAVIEFIKWHNENKPV